MTSTGLTIHDVRDTGAFEYRWPVSVERFTHGWDFAVEIADGLVFQVRHGIGRRVCFGRERLHSVTWIGASPAAEAAEAEDYAGSHALVGVIKAPNGKDARSLDELGDRYAGFEIVRHRDEVVGRFARRSLAVKIRVDDLEQWARFAMLRDADRRARRRR
jgi:hypothetical protein